MNQRTFPYRTDQLLRGALALWLAYFGLLALTDWLLTGRDPNVLYYYAVQTGNSLLILGLSLPLWRRIGKEKALLPVVLALMAILPTLTVHVMHRLAPSAPLRSPDGMTLRLAPILLIGLLLTVWHYRWPYMVLFSVGVAALNLAGIFVLHGAGRGVPPLAYEAVLITGVQAISLLMVGYITSALVSWLRAHQRSLEEANRQLRDYASTQIELTISQERNRIARELHDTLAHTLSGLTVQLQTVKAYWDIEPATAQALLDDALTATRNGLQETRDALKALRAAPLEDLGLALAIRQLAKGAADRANLKLQLWIEEPLPALAPEASHALYRVTQEAIMNVVYHANAKTLSVDLKTDAEGTHVSVADDGIGFERNRVHPNHWGLKGMHERAELVNGQLVLESQIGCGTTVRFTIPEKAS